MEALLEGKDIVKTFGKGDLSINAIDHMNFVINKGELVIILGQSGAGKSTLLNLLGGMDKLTSGQLIVKGEDIAKYDKFKLTEYRRHQIGFVFQFYNLMPNLTALENVELAVETSNNALNPEAVLKEVGLGDCLKKFPSQLSGGQQQRVSIARAIAKNTDLILCDEPTGALDYATGKEILELLQKQAHEEGKTVIIVTHNSALAEMADHLIRVKNGKIVLDQYNSAPTPVEQIEW